LTLYFLRLGTIGFGGPVALIEYMRWDLVEERKWVSETDYMEGLTLSQLAPGHWRRSSRSISDSCTTTCLAPRWRDWPSYYPSFVMVVGLGWAYTLYGGLSWVQAVF
jgi:chromate transporter